MNSQSSSLLRSIAITGIIIGALDAIAGIIHTAIFTKVGPLAMFRYIASGVFGESAFAGGIPMAVLGVFFHFSIASGWTALLYLIYPKLGFVRFNKIPSGIGYGMFIWLMMNLIIVPLSHAPNDPITFKVSTLVMFLIHIFVIGVPMMYLTGNYFSKNNVLNRKQVNL